MSGIRIDKWLWAARFFKTRSLATDAVSGGKVRLNDAPTKPARDVKPGDSLSSVLIMLVEGRADPSIKMPHGKDSLPKEQIEVLKKWVEQGAKNN